MRLPLRESAQFCGKLNSLYSRIQQVYFLTIKSALKTSEVKVMLGDGTVTDSETFELETMILYFNQLDKSMKEWTSSGVSKSKTDDLHRITLKLSINIRRIILTLHFGIQYHTLRYYRVDKRVLEIQKELFDLTEKSNQIQKSIATIGNDMLLEELGNRGYADLKIEDLLEKMLLDETLSSQLASKASQLQDKYPELKNIETCKGELVAELNDYVMEVHTLDGGVIDYNKLMQGQEGFVIYMDVETIANKKSKERQSYVNFENIDLDAQNRIDQYLTELADTIGTFN